MSKWNIPKEVVTVARRVWQSSPVVQSNDLSAADALAAALDEWIKIGRADYCAQPSEIFRPRPNVPHLTIELDKSND